MLRKGIGVLVVLACLAIAQFALSQGEGDLLENPHNNFIQEYEGTKTCLMCHADQGNDVFSSMHYQWKGDAPNIVNADGKKLGKLVTSNDFCTNPAISWIAILKNKDDKLIANGCSKCHIGLGLKPTTETSQEQLENIDCLLCHSYNYKREVYKTDDETLRWRPVAYDQPEVMLNIAQNVQSPNKDQCLQCHATSGGGPNFKRGDIEPAHMKAERDFDVHMGSGMSCIQCHSFEDHKVIGSGTQLAGVDASGKLSCEKCHSNEALHDNDALNNHLDSVNCTSCHIPTFAKGLPTDMYRDWSQSEYLEGKGKYEPLITFEKDVTPVYTWWNGKGKLALLDQPVEVVDGKVKLYEPQGSIDDPESKIYAFKLHGATLPIDKETGLMIPIKVGMVFKAGKNEAAVKTGAKAAMGKEDVQIDWIETERYMALFHEVAPKEQALQCMDCHGDDGRMDWEALGYDGNPMQNGGRQL